MTRKALARRIAELLFNEPATRRGAGAAPTRRAARILAGCFVARRSKTTAGILPPRAAHPATIRSSAATTSLRLGALMRQVTDWCTGTTSDHALGLALASPEAKLVRLPCGLFW